MSPYEIGRRDALLKYAEAVHGALAGGLLGAALPQVTDSVWERPLRSLGGASLGAVMTREPDADPVDTAANTGIGVLGGGVLGGITGGFSGALLDRAMSTDVAGSPATVGGVLIGGTAGGLLGGVLQASRSRRKKREAAAAARAALTPGETAENASSTLDPS